MNQSPYVKQIHHNQMHYKMSSTNVHSLHGNILVCRVTPKKLGSCEASKWTNFHWFLNVKSFFFHDTWWVLARYPLGITRKKDTWVYDHFDPWKFTSMCTPRPQAESIHKIRGLRWGNRRGTHLPPTRGR
jgi:hypothetical protein